MHWFILYLLLLFPNADVQPGTAAVLSKEMHVDYETTVVAEYVDFARSCVNGTGPCY